MIDCMKPPKERDEQILVCKYLDLKKIPYFAIPNGGSRNKIEAGRMKQEGVKAGVSDLCVLLPEKVLFIEMKRVKGSSTSKEQKAWIELFNSYPHIEAKVCKGAVEAYEFIESHI